MFIRDEPLPIDLRESMIDALTEDMNINLASFMSSEWRESIIRHGWVGFDNMSDNDLEKAFRDANLDDDYPEIIERLLKEYFK